MGLVDETQIKELAESIVPAIVDPSPEQTQARNDAVASVQNLTDKIMGYIVKNLEINKLTVATGSLLPETPVLLAMDGGAVLHASTNLPSINGQTLTQNNDGKGLIK